MTISKLLIANRGEIACRIIRTANQLGIKCVAIYSEADADSLHVKMANEAVYIGKSQPQQSYLVKERIIETAKKTKCHAIHPGYGFLSESYEFSKLCSQNNIIFIGAPWKAIRDMGIKSTSKHIMNAANVPIIKGYHDKDQTEERLLKEAENIGFPVMIKAVRGGGGKGMRIAFNSNEFQSKLQSAKVEALKSFNNDEMLVEKFVEKPRHVEVQIFGDQYKNYVYLFERDCSVQRRHQKIIEETPAPGLSEETRRNIGEAACKAASAVDYVGAGTVEFIMDHNQKFYFMEMNTRLQVEHPITEMVTGTDLVEWQLRVARGEILPLRQEDILLKGHSFEARIYAEDPYNNFIPGAGKLKFLQPPTIIQGDPDALNIRIETGVEEGDDVSVHYDPLIAKLVVWSKDRETALQKMRYTLETYKVAGLKTNIPFIMSLCDHKEFLAGNVHTEFIPMHKNDLFKNINKSTISDETACISLASILHFEKEENKKINNAFTNKFISNFWTNYINQKSYSISFCTQKNSDFDIKVFYPSLNDTESSNMIKLEFDDKIFHVRMKLFDKKNRIFQIEVNGHRQKISYFKDLETDIFSLFVDEELHEFKLREPKYIEEQKKANNIVGHESNYPLSPMPGIIDKINVKVGDQVRKGDNLVVMIAMKMEYVIKSPQDGIVKSIHCSIGQNVKKSSKLVTIA